MLPPALLLPYAAFVNTVMIILYACSCKLCHNQAASDTEIRICGVYAKVHGAETWRRHTDLGSVCF